MTRRKAGVRAFDGRTAPAIGRGQKARSSGATFHSSIVHARWPRKPSRRNIRARGDLLDNNGFRTAAVRSAASSVARESEVALKGVSSDETDRIDRNDTGEITAFKVAAQPLKTVNAGRGLMKDSPGYARPYCSRAPAARGFPRSGQHRHTSDRSRSVQGL
jgi:hypothetical protein